VVVDLGAGDGQVEDSGTDAIRVLDGVLGSAVGQAVPRIVVCVPGAGATAGCDVGKLLAGVAAEGYVVAAWSNVVVGSSDGGGRVGGPSPARDAASAAWQRWWEGLVHLAAGRGAAGGERGACDVAVTFTAVATGSPDAAGGPALGGSGRPGRKVGAWGHRD
jgi:hypothetical protein